MAESSSLAPVSFTILPNLIRHQFRFHHLLAGSFLWSRNRYYDLPWSRFSHPFIAFGCSLWSVDRPIPPWQSGSHSLRSQEKPNEKRIIEQWHIHLGLPTHGQDPISALAFLGWSSAHNSPQITAGVGHITPTHGQDQGKWQPRQ